MFSDPRLLLLIDILYTININDKNGKGSLQLPFEPLTAAKVKLLKCSLVPSPSYAPRACMKGAGHETS